MAHYARSEARSASLMATRRALLMLSTVVRLGLMAVGLGLVLDRTRALLSDLQLTWGERVVLGIALVAYGGGFALAGWVADRLLKALAELIGLLVDQAESASTTARLLEREVAPSLARIALAVERLSALPASGPDQAAEQRRAIAVAGVRQAIDEGRWDRADRLIASLRRDFPEAPEADELAEDLARARGRAIDDLKGRLDAAQAVNDPDQVLTYRDELTLHLQGDDLKELDRRVVGWLIMLIQRRLRAGGGVRAEVVELASRTAESFGDTPEGASLRASLPTLRRSAGLCPRCSRPYTGTEDACPECLRAVPRRAAGPPPIGSPAPEKSS
ncbi:hypothetical protein AB1L88_07215 [Tautonia sp. JC769]|uniref:hypothetical protein n=1 Tax=Tautonia sp. JC769 TaxID=3232135 RepID=UPI00345A7AD5